MTYSIEIKKNVLKSLKAVPRRDQVKIAKNIQKLASNPRPANCAKLSGFPYYRLRCGQYRIIYEIIDKKLVIIVLKIGHRKEIYRER